MTVRNLSEETHRALKARAVGSAVGDVDALIAAIARAHRFGVATKNVAPFEAAGVATVIDPFAKVGKPGS